MRHLLGDHQVVTAAYMGWSGLKNGELLRAARENGIEVVVTGDQTLNQEENLTGKRLAVVALSAVEPIIKGSLQEIIAAITNAIRDRFSWSNAACLAEKGQRATKRFSEPPRVVS